MRNHLTRTGSEVLAIDFARATLTWQLAQPQSAGRFALDSALTVVAADGTRETFHLGAQVFAGNVYGEGILFKQPPYEFAAAFSTLRFRIFRSAHVGVQADTYGHIATAFAGVAMDLPSVPCRALETRAAVVLQAAPRLAARTRWTTADGIGLELEFPVRHVNLDVARDKFQVETGPVLTLAPSGGSTVERLRRAYVIFNRLDRMEMLLDDPAVGGVRWGTRLAMPCEIELLAIGE